MTELQELIKDAPKFDLMERGELVVYAYAMYAAGAKADAENAKLRELVRGLHMAYIGIIGKCESLDSSLTLEFSSDIDADLAKHHANYEQNRHRFDMAMHELGVEVDE